MEDNCFISLSPSNPVILSMTSRSQTVAAVSMTKVTSLSHPLSLNVVSLLEQSAFCILNNDVKWQHENLPQTLKGSHIFGIAACQSIHTLLFNVLLNFDLSVNSRIFVEIYLHAKHAVLISLIKRLLCTSKSKYDIVLKQSAEEICT